MSDAELSFITNSNPGEGILYNGVCCIPFANQLPKETLQYKAMTTKAGEAAQAGDLKALHEQHIANPEEGEVANGDQQ